MSEQATGGSDRDRGTSSKDGFSNVETPGAGKDTPVDPNLAPPADGTSNPPTHPNQIGGLGESGPEGSQDKQPVAPGDPMTESDRTDTQ